MVQMPELISVVALPDTEQTDGVVEAKETVSPELAEALKAGDAPNVCDAIEANVMVCVCATTVPVFKTSRMLPAEVPLPTLAMNASPCPSTATA